MYAQIIVFSIIAMILYLFIDGRIRYDFVALLSAIILAITGVIPAEEAFLGFSHPAIITIASVLVISAALIKTGVIDTLVILINKTTDNLTIKLIVLMVITAALSGFMNNVGALALILPIALTIAKDNKISPSQLLMPIAFASLLGGMITSIGTPPNLIVSSYRVEAGYEPFSFFAFAPVGIILTIIGIVFTSLLGWRLIPKRRTRDMDGLFNIEDYLFEFIVDDKYKLLGRTLRDMYIEYNLEMNVLSIVRNKSRIIAPTANEQLLLGDIVIVQLPSTDVTSIMKYTGLSLNTIRSDKSLKSDDIALVEVVLREDSFLIGRTVLETNLRNRYNVNLVAVSRKGSPNIKRLKNFRFRKGDVLLIQVSESRLQDTYAKLRCLPLAQRKIDIKTARSSKEQILTLGIFVISIIATTLGLIPVQISFALGAVLLVLLKIITVREFYDAIEWSTIIMLGSLFAIGNALEASGASETIAGGLMLMSNIINPSMMVLLLMTLTVLLTNLIGNSATAVLIGPIVLSLASSMQVSPDPLLMSVSVASAAAFLTPIGHQSNMLVMEPGGYKFSDYWHLGLPLVIITLVVGGPLILFFWPL